MGKNGVLPDESIFLSAKRNRSLMFAQLLFCLQVKKGWNLSVPGMALVQLRDLQGDATIDGDGNRPYDALRLISNPL
jgi:hypothetical protein